MHGNPHGSLEGSANIVTVPGDALWHVWVHADRHEEARKVLDAIVMDTSQQCEP